MKKFVTSFLLCLFLFELMFVQKGFSQTIWADDSLNEVIIKQYDANALRDEYLPVLPDSLKREQSQKIDKTTTSQKQNTAEKEIEVPLQEVSVKKPVYDNSYSTNLNNSNDYVLLKKGTKFKLRIEQPIDDSAPVGSDIQFTSLYPESSKYITIPAGTRFIGSVQDSHLPQISANGGLLVISIDSLIYNNRRYPLNAKVTMVGNKHIFQNNIKGKHTYWKGVAKTAKPSINFYKKAWNTTKKFAKDGLEVILTPITFVGGVTVLAVGTISSPFVALFTKGERLFINKGTHFQIKLLEDTQIKLH